MLVVALHATSGDTPGNMCRIGLQIPLFLSAALVSQVEAGSRIRCSRRHLRMDSLLHAASREVGI